MYHICHMMIAKESIMAIDYETIRMTDKELHTKAKSRAALENKTMIQLVEKAIKDYLKKPIDK